MGMRHREFFFNWVLKADGISFEPILAEHQCKKRASGSWQIEKRLGERRDCGRGGHEKKEKKRNDPNSTVAITAPEWVPQFVDRDVQPQQRDAETREDSQCSCPGSY